MDRSSTKMTKRLIYSGSALTCNAKGGGYGYSPASEQREPESNDENSDQDEQEIDSDTRPEDQPSDQEDGPGDGETDPDAEDANNDQDDVFVNGRDVASSRPEEFRWALKIAPPVIINEVRRLQKENKNLRGQYYDSKKEQKDLRIFSNRHSFAERAQIDDLREELQDAHDRIDALQHYLSKSSESKKQLDELSISSKELISKLTVNADKLQIALDEHAKLLVHKEKELAQAKAALEKLSRKMRNSVECNRSSPPKVTKPLNAFTSYNDVKTAKSHDCKHTADHAGHQGQKNSAKDRLYSAFKENVARQTRCKARGEEFVISPPRQIYVGNIAFDATTDDVLDAITECTHFEVDEVEMPRTNGRHRGYAFVTVAWPPEYKTNDIDITTFCAALFRLKIKGRPIYAKEAHHRGK